jgi:dUTP pyrophosphatase
VAEIEIALEQMPHAMGLALPHYTTDGAAGMDVCAAIDADILLAPGVRMAVPTGLRMAIPLGYEVQVRPRSGLAINYGVTVVNAPGTIDSDYRGEVKILLINHGDQPLNISRGDRIAQLVVAPVTRGVWRFAGLDDTKRGSGGFGSTGL